MALRFLTVACLVAGCTMSDVARFEEHPPRPPDAPVAVYATDDAPAAVFEHAKRGTPPGRPIAKVSSRSNSPFPTWSGQIEYAQKKARELGGDAILIGSGSEAWKELSITVYRR